MTCAQTTLSESGEVSSACNARCDTHACGCSIWIEPLCGILEFGQGVDEVIDRISLDLSFEYIPLRIDTGIAVDR
jgi:hypothetical protein